MNRLFINFPYKFPKPRQFRLSLDYICSEFVSIKKELNKNKISQRYDFIKPQVSKAMTLDLDKFSSFLQSIEFDSMNNMATISTTQNAVLKTIDKIFSGLTFGKDRTNWKLLYIKWNESLKLWTELYQDDPITYSEEPETSEFKRPSEPGLRKLRDRLNTALKSCSNVKAINCKHSVIEYLCLIFFTRTYEECASLTENQLLKEVDPIFMDALEFSASGIKSILAYGFGVPIMDSSSFESMFDDNQAQLKYIVLSPHIVQEMDYEDIFDSEEEKITYLQKAKEAEKKEQLLGRIGIGESSYPLRSPEDFRVFKQILWTNYNVLINIYERINSKSVQVKVSFDEEQAREFLKHENPVNQMTVVNPHEKKTFLFLNTYYLNQRGNFDRSFGFEAKPEYADEMDRMTDFWKSYIEKLWNHEKVLSYEEVMDWFENHFNE